MKKLFLIILIGFAMCETGYTQDMHFSQYYANPLYLNPAFAGVTWCPRLTVNFRNQWPSIEGTYTTYSAAYDQHVENLSGGVGLMFNSDNAGGGVLKTNVVSGIYSYRLPVTRVLSVKAAIQATYFQKSLDWNKLTFGDMIDSKYGFVKYTMEQRMQPTKGAVDFSAGILGYSENYFGGVAVNHLTQPDEGFAVPSKLPMKVTAHAGAVIDLKDRNGKRKQEDPSISVNVLYQKQKDFEQMNYGFYLNKYPMVGGVWFRQDFKNPDALIFLIGFQSYSCKFGYSYDMTISKLSNSSGGAHELSFTIQFNCKPPTKRIRPIDCPYF